MLPLISSCGTAASLPTIKPATPEIVAKTHLPRPRAKIKAQDLNNPVALKEAIRDLQDASDAVYDDYLTR